MSTSGAQADAVADFYDDRNLTILVGFSPGGGVTRRYLAFGARLTAALRRRAAPPSPSGT